MSSVAQYIVNGLGLELNLNLAQYVETELDTVCAITGERISEGILWKHIIMPCLPIASLVTKT